MTLMPPRPNHPSTPAGPMTSRGPVPDYPRVLAKYHQHPIKRFNGNPLIEALPTLLEHVALGQKLTYLPAYDESERGADRAVRIVQIKQLSRLYIGFPRVVELVESMHAMICEGYVGRAPLTAEANALRQATYDRQQSGQDYDIANPDEGAEFCAALIGFPGIGKTQAIKRASQLYQRIIYHPDLAIWQIPILRIELPSDGLSKHTLANAIIRELDRIFPEGQYARLYLGGRANAESRLYQAVAVMQAHYVGLLLVDESQSHEYALTDSSNGRRSKPRAKPGQIPLTRILISVSNYSQIPLLLTGTPELREVMGDRMSQVRRMTGSGFRVWGPLSLGTDEEMGEFDLMLHMLWTYQWTKTPFELTDRMRNLFYYHTQGISDLIVKLYQDCQTRAIRNGGDELVTEEVVHSVAVTELAAMTELTAHLRKKDAGKLHGIADVAAYLRMPRRQAHFQTPLFSEQGDEEPEIAVEPVSFESHREQVLPEGALVAPPAEPSKRRKKAKASVAPAAFSGHSGTRGNADLTAAKTPNAVDDFNSMLDE